MGRISIIFLILLSAPRSWADCTVPAASAGTIQFFTPNLMFCDGISWLTLATTGTGGFANGGNSFGSTAVLGTNDSNRLDLETNNTTRLTVAATTGYVGIGTTAPSLRLQVEDGPTSGLAKFRNTNASGYSGIDLHDSADAIQLSFGYANLSAGWRPGTVYFNSNSNAPMIFAMGSGEKMRLDTSGNVGIGTTTPSEELTIAGDLEFTSSANRRISVEDSAFGGAPSLTLEGGNAAVGVGGALNLLGGEQLNGINVGGSVFINGGAGSAYGNVILGDAGGNVGIGTTNPNTKFQVTASQGIPATSGGGSGNAMMRLQTSSGGETFNFGMRIIGNPGSYAWLQASNSVAYGINYYLALNPNGGNVGVGTTSPAARLDVTDTSTTSSAILVPRAGNFTGTNVDGMIRYNTTSNLFEFRQNGAWVNFTTVSDERLKTNVVPVINGLEILNGLHPVFYDWDRTNPRTYSFKEGREVGFTAQDVEKVLPEVVNHGEDGTLSIEYGKIVAIVVDAIKSVAAQTDSSKREIEALKDENSKLQKQIQIFKLWICERDPSAEACKL